MQSPSLQCTSTHHYRCLGFQHTVSSTQNRFSSLFALSTVVLKSCTSKKQHLVAQAEKPKPNNAAASKLKGKKSNVWSVDNEMAKPLTQKQNDKHNNIRSRRKRKVKRNKSAGTVLVSSAMLVEVEKVLQTQEPVIRPFWNTFASSVSGIWKGVGAVYSPITAEMEPIDVSTKNEHLYDCFILSHVEALPPTPGEQTSRIKRRINWVTLNPYGEKSHSRSATSFGIGEMPEESSMNHILPKYESFDFATSDIMEEDVMAFEPGLVFFEDGSYSRGPIDIPVGEVDGSNYYLSPTLKFEQCLVKGCHKRVRIVHTIEFANGGADIQIMRVAVYEEQWINPVSIPDTSDMEFNAKPFSQRKRTHPSELVGSWKVFEVSATPIFGEEESVEESNGSIPYVYLCTENLKKRSFPESANYFGEEEIIDMQDVTVLWLPGGMTGYVDIRKDGILCIGFSWYSEEGINLVMERDYGVDGKLKEVRWKSELKRRWSDPDILPA